MRLVENEQFDVRPDPLLRFARKLRTGLNNSLRAIIEIWNIAFPMPSSPNDPSTPPTISKAQALREGAKLGEDVDAFSRKRVA